MSAILRVIQREFQHCQLCGSPSQAEALCQSCELGLDFNLEALRPNEDLGYRRMGVLSLLNWDTDLRISASVKNLIEHQKVRPNSILADWFASRMRLATRLITRDYTDHEIEVVYPAASRSRAENHARILAEALAAQCGLKLSDRALGSSQRHQFIDSQKQKSALERSAFRYNSPHDILDSSVGTDRPVSTTQSPSPQPKKLVLFVDDVIVSGGTARAAYHALGQPIGFWVLALAYRKLSADSEQ